MSGLNVEGLQPKQRFRQLGQKVAVSEIVRFYCFELWVCRPRIVLHPDAR
jgi:hypothetical protein